MNILKLFKHRQFIKYLFFIFSYKKMKNQFINQYPVKKRKHFYLNLLFGSIIIFFLHFAHLTGMGQEMLNSTYDFLVKEDYYNSIDHKYDSSPFSDSIRIIAFDREAYDNCYSNIFWTSRELLGKSILKSLELGAKIVLVHFAIDTATPYKKENEVFLYYLKEASNLAKKKNAVIFFPWAEKKQSKCPEQCEYSAELFKIIHENVDVFKFGVSSVLMNPKDGKVRHIRFYKKVTNNMKNTDTEISNDKKSTLSIKTSQNKNYLLLKTDRYILSLPVLAAIYSLFNKQQADLFTSSFNPHVDNNIVIKTEKGDSRILKLLAQNINAECLEARIKFRLIADKLPRDIGDWSSIKSIVIPVKELDAIISENFFHNKIILIGTTYEVMGNSLFTPLGKMPSIFIIANYLNQILKGEQIQTPNKFFIFVIQLLLIFIISIFFLTLPGTYAAICLTALIIILYTPLSIYLFSKHGCFIDFWAPIVGISILENIFCVEEYFEELLKKKE